MKYYITPEFASVISASRLESLNKHPCAAYGLDSELNIAYQNPASHKFSKENSCTGITDQANDSSLGINIYNLIPAILVPSYKALFDSVINEQGAALTSKQVEYECSSDELYRIYSMHLYSLREKGLLVVHSLLVEEPYRSNAKSSVDENHYISEQGFVTQCSNCRRIKNLTKEGQWDWIPKWVKEPHKPTSHGICRPCRHHYYPKD